eukprot:4276831-Karenia_brevis.AAC.1
MCIRDRNKPNIKCYGCGGLGHIGANCPNKGKGKGKDGGGTGGFQGKGAGGFQMGGSSEVGASTS